MKQIWDKASPYVSQLNSYKETTSAKSLTLDEAKDLLKGQDFITSLKIDGEENLLVFENGKALFYSREGRVRSDFPIATETQSLLNKYSKVVAVGELHVVNDKNEPVSYPEAVSTLRVPENREEQIRFIVFDLYEVDGEDWFKKSYDERVQKINELFSSGKYIKPAEFAKDSVEVLDKFWAMIKPNTGYEGIVVTLGKGLTPKEKIKIKPSFTQDLAVLGIEYSPEHEWMSALMLSYIDESGKHRYAGKVGTGFSTQDRREWYDWAQNIGKDHPEKNQIFVPPEKTRVVQIKSDELRKQETPLFEYKDGDYITTSEAPSAIGRKPVFERIRTDKKPVSTDVRLEQIPGFKESAMLISAKSKYDYKFVVKNDDFINNFKHLEESFPGNLFVIRANSPAQALAFFVARVFDVSEEVYFDKQYYAYSGKNALYSKLKDYYGIDNIFTEGEPLEADTVKDEQTQKEPEKKEYQSDLPGMVDPYNRFIYETTKKNSNFQDTLGINNRGFNRMSNEFQLYDGIIVPATGLAGYIIYINESKPGDVDYVCYWPDPISGLEISEVHPTEIQKASSEDLELIDKQILEKYHEKFSQDKEQSEKKFKEELKTDTQENTEDSSKGNSINDLIGKRVRSLTMDAEGAIVNQAPKDRGGTPQDVDLVIAWDVPLLGIYKQTEVHPTEIELLDKSLNIQAYIPDHPDKIKVQANQYYKEGLTEDKIYKHWKSVEAKILPQFKNYNVMTVINTDGTFVHKKNDSEGNPIHLKSSEDYEKYIATGGTLGAHLVIPGDTTQLGWVDIDPRPEVPFDEVKRITTTLHDYLSEMDLVRDTKVQFSGDRGFHILLNLKSAMNVNELRQLLQQSLQDFIKDMGNPQLTLTATKDPKSTRLDISTLKRGGSIRATYSLNEKTGLVAVPVDIDKIDSFDKAAAKVEA